jgi:hypothetical protein
MLSFLFRLMRAYQREHGFLPNVLYINDFHYRKLRESLPELTTHEEIAAFLQLDVILRAEAVHPSIAWIKPLRQPFAIGG